MDVTTEPRWECDANTAPTSTANTIWHAAQHCYVEDIVVALHWRYQGINMGWVSGQFTHFHVSTPEEEVKRVTQQYLELHAIKHGYEITEVMWGY